MAGATGSIPVAPTILFSDFSHLTCQPRLRCRPESDNSGPDRTLTAPTAQQKRGTVISVPHGVALTAGPLRHSAAAFAVHRRVRAKSDEDVNEGNAHVRPT
jgi:hypothetical protein